MVVNINQKNFFKPKIHSYDLEYHLNQLKEVQIENDKIYELVQQLTNLAHPTYEDQSDKRWEYFYLPIKRGRNIIVIPIWIMDYNNQFFLTIQSFGSINIAKANAEAKYGSVLKHQAKANTEALKKGDIETEKFYYDMIEETIRFIPIIKKDEEILQKILPYDIRTGKIKGRYILNNLLSQDRKKTISENYKNHIEKNLEIKEISLNDYLNVTAICYRAAYDKKTENLSNIEMYKKWADGRDGGMLSIKDWDSKNEFSQWYHSGESAGSHPFEIVFSWHEHGIHLYPLDDSRVYNLRVTNYNYAWDFLKMVDALIIFKIPFKVDDLDNVLDFLAGDTYFMVNKRTEHHFTYILSKEYEEKYFPYIEWDGIKIVKWKY